MTLGLVVAVVFRGTLPSKTDSSSRAIEGPASCLSSAIERIGLDLRRSAHARIVIDASEPQADFLRLQIREGTTPGHFGAEDERHGFLEDWSVRYAVRDGTLFRESLDPLGNPRCAEPILSGIDSPRFGEKGFSVRRWDSLYTVTIRICERTASEGPKRRSCALSFAVDD